MNDELSLLLIASIDNLAAEVKRYNDSHTLLPMTVQRGEAEFGIAKYENKALREQTEEFFANLAPTINIPAPRLPRGTNRPAAPKRASANSSRSKR